VIRLVKINKMYNHTQAGQMSVLKDISFTVKENEFTLLNGPSGSGKSTILSIIGGLIKPTSGKVYVDGKSIAKLPDKFSALIRREKIGFIFQKFNLVHDLNVIDNVTIPLIPGKLHKAEIEKRAESILKDLSILDKKYALVKNLSGGEQQRVAIARSLINQPKIILADEPTANLDKKLSYAFIKIMKELKEKGKTILLASHDPLFSNLNSIDNVINIHLGEIK